MLDDIKSVFRDTWSAFRAEAGRREPADEVADLLGRMRREMVQARAALPAFEEAVRAAEQELEAERRALSDCRRREGLAERIGDAETARVAAEFGARHAERIAVLEQKVEASRAESALRASEADEMMRRYKQADANRFALLSQVRMHRARERVQGLSGADSFEEFERTADGIRDQAAYVDALNDLDDSGAAPDPAAPTQAERERLAEERLRELKRRMGQE